jgi:hypothetical protein
MNNHHIRISTARAASVRRRACGILAVALWGVAALTVSAAAPRIVSINLLGATSDSVAMVATATNNFAGAPGVRAQYWNDMPTGVNSLTSVTDQTGAGVVDGSSVPMGVNFTQSGGGSRFNGVASPGNNEARMFNGVYDQFENGTSILEATNIPFTSYNVYCYTRPDAGGSFRGGFFYVTNTAAKKWIKGGTVSGTTIALPDNNGIGYVESSTATAPTSFSQISAGHFVSFKNITGPTLRVEMSAVGAGAGGVLDGDGARRHKVVGFQIVEVPSSGAATNLSLGATIPSLLGGNPVGFQLMVIGDYDEGFSYPVSTLQTIAYASENPSIFTVNSGGSISALNPGTANLVVTFTNLNLGTISLTQAVTVLAPISVSVPTLALTNMFVGNNAADTSQAKMLATFLGSTNVDVTAYTTMVWSTQPSSVATISSLGLVTAVAPGTFSVIGTIGGLSATNASGTVATSAAPGSVPVLSFNISDAVNLANFKDLSGAPGARTAYWNNIPLLGATASNQISNPLDYHGAIKSGTVAVVTGKSTSGTGTSGTLTTNEAKIFRCFYDSGLNSPAGGSDPNFPNTSATEGIIAVTNVPYAKYDVYFYAYNDTGALNRPGHFTVAETGETRWRKNVATLSGGTGNITPNETTGGGYLEATPIISGGSIPNSVVPGTLANVPGGNYVKFSNLTNATLVVTWGSDSTDTVIDANTVTRLRLVGFQIVNTDLNNVQATNIFLSASVANLLPGNPVTTSVNPLVNFLNGVQNFNVSTAEGTTYDSSNPSIFTVSPWGVITPGTTPGTANLIIHYTNAVSSVSLTQAVTVLAPLSVKATATPAVLYLDSVLGTQTSQVKLLATFNGYTNVDISAFNTVTIGDYEPAIASVSGGVATPVGLGLADLGGFYLGTEYITANVLTIRSINDAPSLAHRYSFRDGYGSSTVVDSIGGANGSVFTALNGYQNITLDGEFVQFPGDAGYTNAPYVALPSGILSGKSDVTFDFWFRVNQNKDWARIFDAGVSSKDTDPHNAGSVTTQSIVYSPKPGGSGPGRFEIKLPAGNAFLAGTTTLPVGIEQHVTLVYSPNQNIIKMYVNGVLENSMTPVAGATLNTLAETHVWLGVSGNNDPTLAGGIDELRIYEGAFSDADVAASQTAGASDGLPVLARPSLAITPSGSNAILSWPIANNGSILYSNTVLDGIWYPVNLTPTTVGANLQLTVPATATNAFFSLQKP